jgi:hypothetical protein
MERASGVISWWDGVLRQGVIRQNKARAFYLYASKIVSGTPRKGVRVDFQFNPEQKLKPGHLPKAHNAIVRDYTVGARALATGLPSKEQSDDGR